MSKELPVPLPSGSRCSPSTLPEKAGRVKSDSVALAEDGSNSPKSTPFDARSAEACYHAKIVYGDVVQELDHRIGEILEVLESTKLAEDTIVSSCPTTVLELGNRAR